MADIEQAIEAQTEKTNEFLAKRNVVGVAVGFKNQLGETSGEPSVVVLVQQKKPVEALSEEDLIPREIDGLPTDVVQIGFLRAQADPRQRFRPVIQPGVSIAHYQVGAGTLGAIVRHRETGERYLLSNNHVFANSNDAQIGDDILQPGPLDGGVRPGDTIAHLSQFRTLAYIEDAVQDPPTTPEPDPDPQPDPEPTPTPPADSGCDVVEATVALANGLAQLTGSTKRVQAAQMATAASQSQPTLLAAQSLGGSPAEVPMIVAQSLDNLLDAAIAKPIDASMFSDEILNIGRVTGTKSAALGMNVVKSGRTTGYTEGRITLLNATVNVQYETINGTRTARFVNQVITTGMSSSGDSGSLVVDPTDRTAVGLLFAGSEFATIFTPIDRILSVFNMEI